MISVSGLLGQTFAILLALLLAPLLSGWVGQCRAWLQSRSAPPLLLPYYMLHKLFHKDVVLANGASSLFRAAPFVIFGCMVLACAISPSLSTDLPLAPAAGGGQDVERDHGLAELGVHPGERGLVRLREEAVQVLGLEHYLAHFLTSSPKLPLPMPTALPSSKSRWHSRA